MNTAWLCSTEKSLWETRSFSTPSGAATGRLQVTDRALQTWDGFGGCFNELGWAALAKLSDGDRQTVMRELFDPADGLGLNLCRVPIGASDYAIDWYSNNDVAGDLAMEHFSIARDQQHLIPYIRAAMRFQPNLKIFASPWSPPAWMKYPATYNFGTLVWTKENLAAYALYFLKFVRAYQAAGLPVRQVHVQNEPNSDQKFPSCLWTGEKMRDFIRDYLGPLFQREKIDCEIWAGTIERGDYNAWANTILSDPAARSFVSGVGYQWAGRDAVQKTHLSWPDVKLMQTENECGDGTNSWDYAGYVFDLAHHYLMNGVSGYCYWNMVLPAGGVSTWGWKQNSMYCVDTTSGTLTRNPEYYVMRHFASAAKPGAVRLATTGNLSSNAVAFRNPDGSTAVVMRNPFSASRTVQITTPAGEFAAELPGKSFHSFSLPASL